MAIDTLNKRASVLGINTSAPRLEQTPTGAIRHLGRHMAAYIYVGITIQVIGPTISNNQQLTTMYLDSHTRTTRFLDHADIITLLGG